MFSVEKFESRNRVMLCVHRIFALFRSNRVLSKVNRVSYSTSNQSFFSSSGFDSKLIISHFIRYLRSEFAYWKSRLVHLMNVSSDYHNSYHFCLFEYVSFSLWEYFLDAGVFVFWIYSRWIGPIHDQYFKKIM